MTLLETAALTLRAPREGLRAVLSLGLPAGARWAALLLMGIGSAVLLHISLVLTPMPDGSSMAQFLAPSPFQTALIQVVMLVVLAVLSHVVGRVFRGEGAFNDSVLMVVWLQMFFVALQAAQLVLMVLMPPLAGLLGLASVVLFFWLLTPFVAEVHGFRSHGKVFLGILLTLLVFSFILSMILVSALGPEALPNV